MTRALLVLLPLACSSVIAADRPNVVLVMADDMGWAQTGYYGHPMLKTPNLDAMAAGGLRMDRFYAGAPACTPTRATVLTGRTNDCWRHQRCIQRGVGPPGWLGWQRQGQR